MNNELAEAKRVLNDFNKYRPDYEIWPPELHGKAVIDAMRKALAAHDARKDEIGVHLAHCCKRHGCKYGDKDCPVAFGDAEQLYLCDACVEDEREYGVAKKGGGVSDDSLIVARNDCSAKAWALLEHRANEMQRMRSEIVELYRRLCRYEGHLPISDSEGRWWCERCVRSTRQFRKLGGSAPGSWSPDMTDDKLSPEVREATKQRWLRR